MVERRLVEGGVSLTLAPAGPDHKQNEAALRRFFVTVCETLRACRYDTLSLVTVLSESMAYLLAELPPEVFTEARDEMIKALGEDATRHFRRKVM